MKKRLLIGALMCFVVLKGSAQVYAYDTWTQLPTMDLYDTGMMNMYARALAETSARRQAKKDYKKGKKYHCAEASLALKSLKARKKRR